MTETTDACLMSQRLLPTGTCHSLICRRNLDGNPSKPVQLEELFAQFVPELRGCYCDEGLRPLTDSSPLQISDTMFRDNIGHLISWRGDRLASVQGCHDPRRFAFRSR